MKKLPPGHDLTVTLFAASNRCGIKVDVLRELLAKAPWVRLGLHLWGSMASTRLVTLRRFDEVDALGRPIAVKGGRS